MLKNLFWIALGLLLALAAAAWWTPWLDPHVPALPAMRDQARATAVGDALSPKPEPRWITVAGRDKATCLRETQGELNEAFVRCRSGHRELVRDNRDGTRTVLETQSLTEPEGLNPSRRP